MKEFDKINSILFEDKTSLQHCCNLWSACLNIEKCLQNCLTSSIFTIVAKKTIIAIKEAPKVLQIVPIKQCQRCPWQTKLSPIFPPNCLISPIWQHQIASLLVYPLISWIHFHFQLLLLPIDIKKYRLGIT